MSTSLARRIRRIGLAPTTYKTSEESKIVVKDGEEKTITYKVRTPIRHHVSITYEQLCEKSIRIRYAWRLARRARKMRERNVKKSTKILAKNASNYSKKSSTKTESYKREREARKRGGYSC
jgi:hypothetical protein